MFKDFLTKFMWSVLSLGVLAETQAFAQTKTCDLHLEVILNQEANEIEETPIKNASAILVNRETNKEIKSILKEEMPYFSKILEGRYILKVTKKEYKTTIKESNLDCRLANDQGAVSEIIFLWKGDSKQIAQMSYSSPSIRTGDNYPSSIPNLNFNRTVVKFVRPEYPEAARRVKVFGSVSVRVEIDEEGNVISATATSGHLLLYAAAEKAARACKFSPYVEKGQPVKSRSVLSFSFSKGVRNFVPFHFTNKFQFQLNS